MNRATKSLALLIMTLFPVMGLQAAIDTDFSPRPNERWLLIDDQSATLTVYEGNQQIEHFEPISLGRGGAAPLRVRGDRKTPTGEFRINRVNMQSRFHIFLGLNYPTPAHVRKSFNAGLIDRDEYEAYHQYMRRYGEPPQDTPLGGDIGIHGLGEGDEDIHGRFHWTQGCIAVTNEQIEWLNDNIDIGTRVVIR